MQIIIRKILLDHMLLVSRADHKIVVSIMGIQLHNVPEDRLVADFNHRLWPQVALFGQSGSKPAG
ncbi:hypothetical protein SDC9_163277 [bioreactor metagenome]|uniref:Uncharacterized protein n=1 Tax=bioreactor metagenome TaxID=1076179 RepID=A0A645FNF4_9ZZZZ